MGRAVAENGVFYAFFAIKNVRDQWLNALKREDTGWNPDHCGMCELHFRPDDFMDETFRKTQRQRKILKTSAVPSVFDCYPR